MGSMKRLLAINIKGDFMKQAKFFKLLLPAALLIASSILLQACSDAQGDSDQTAFLYGGPSETLFVQTARTGTLVPQGDGSMLLTLEDPDPRAVFFSDRPSRDSGTLSTPMLIDTLFGGEDPPNAALVIEGEGASGVLPIELSNPVLGDDSVTYTATLLENFSSGLSHYQAALVTQGPEAFGEVALFLDGSWRYTIGGYATKNVVAPSSSITFVNDGPGSLQVSAQGGRNITVRPGSSHGFTVAGGGLLSVTNPNGATCSFMISD